MTRAPSRRHTFATAALVRAASLAAAPASSQLHDGNRLRPIGAPGPRSNADALDICLDYLERNRAALGLATDDLDEIVLRDRYDTKKSGLTHLYLRQQIEGIDVEGAELVAAVDRDGRLLSQGDRLVRGLRGRIDTRTPEITAGAAVLAAAAHLGLAAPTSLETRRAPGGVTREVVFAPSGISRDEIPTRLRFVVTEPGRVRISWNLVVRTPAAREPR